MASIDTLIDEETLIDFEEYAFFELSDFLFDFQIFVNQHYENIISYFRGDTNVLNQDSAERLERLVVRNVDLQEKLNLFISDYDTFNFWSLLEYLEDVGIEIERANVIFKYLRSAKFPGFNENSLVQDYSMTNADTLETIADKDRDDSQNAWIDIAVKNQLLEVDYVAQQGGVNLKLGKKVLGTLFLESVVDRLQGDTIYGLDMDRNFEFDIVEEDIKVLSPQDTFKQSVDILAELVRHDIPEFPNLGVSSNRIVGSNLADFAFTFVSRELSQTFSTDDTIVNFSVKNLKRVGSTFFIEFQLESFFNFVYNKNIEVQI